MPSTELTGWRELFKLRQEEDDVRTGTIRNKVVPI